MNQTRQQQQIKRRFVNGDHRLAKRAHALVGRRVDATFGSGLHTAAPLGHPGRNCGPERRVVEIGAGQYQARTGLHAEQEYTYHRQLNPGDVLTAEAKPGKEWEKEGRRGGTLKFTEAITEYRDQNGELVITARSVGVTTEKAVEN